MPGLSIIPARAVMDAELSGTQIRALCAIGMHTDKLGGNVWASVATLAREAAISERTFQSACQVLVERGYVRVVPRPGRTNLYAVVLDDPGHGVMATPATATAPHPRNSSCTPTPAIAAAPERPHLQRPNSYQIAPEEQAICKRLYSEYPKREGDNPYLPAQKAILTLLRNGVQEVDLASAVMNYQIFCKRHKRIGTVYVKTAAKFFSDDVWREYHLQSRVDGQTREEWARSGRDLREFDARLSGRQQRFAASEMQEAAL